MGEFCVRIQNIAIDYSLHYAGLDFSNHCSLASRWARGSFPGQRAAVPERETAASGCGEPGRNPGKNVFMADRLLATLANACRKWPAPKRIKSEQVLGIQRETGHRICAGGEAVATPALLGSHRQASSAIWTLHDRATHRLKACPGVERLDGGSKIT